VSVWPLKLPNVVTLFSVLTVVTGIPVVDISICPVSLQLLLAVTISRASRY